MSLFLLIVFELFMLLLLLKNSFAEEPVVVKTRTPVLLEDFQRKVRLLHNITGKQLDQSGFIKIRKNVWYRTVLWQGSYFGPIPFFVLKKHAVVVRERVEKLSLEANGRFSLTMFFSMPASVEKSKTIDGHDLVANLLRKNVFGGYSSVGDFIADTQTAEIKISIFKHEKNTRTNTCAIMEKKNCMVKTKKHCHFL